MNDFVKEEMKDHHPGNWYDTIYDRRKTSFKKDTMNFIPKLVNF